MIEGTSSRPEKVMSVRRPMAGTSNYRDDVSELVVERRAVCVARTEVVWGVGHGRLRSRCLVGEKTMSSGVEGLLGRGSTTDAQLHLTAASTRRTIVALARVEQSIGEPTHQDHGGQSDGTHKDLHEHHAIVQSDSVTRQRQQCPDSIVCGHVSCRRSGG